MNKKTLFPSLVVLLSFCCRFVVVLVVVISFTKLPIGPGLIFLLTQQGRITLFLEEIKPYRKQTLYYYASVLAVI